MSTFFYLMLLCLGLLRFGQHLLGYAPRFRPLVGAFRLSLLRKTLRCQQVDLFDMHMMQALTQQQEVNTQVLIIDQLMDIFQRARVDHFQADRSLAGCCIQGEQVVNHVPIKSVLLAALGFCEPDAKLFSKLPSGKHHELTQIQAGWHDRVFHDLDSMFQLRCARAGVCETACQELDPTKFREVLGMNRDTFMSHAYFGVIGAEIKDSHLCLRMSGLQVLQ